MMHVSHLFGHLNLIKYRNQGLWGPKKLFLTKIGWSFTLKNFALGHPKHCYREILEKNIVARDSGSTWPVF